MAISIDLGGDGHRPSLRAKLSQLPKGRPENLVGSACPQQLQAPVIAPLTATYVVGGFLFYAFQF